MEIKDLKPNPKNPRKISEPKLEQLRAALTEFGDLGGFVFNRKTKCLVGGHQRVKLFDARSQIVIDKKYPKPTKAGTVAEGSVVFSNGERFKYREVSWDETKEKAANIAANKGAGEWDEAILSEWLRDIDSYGFDLDLTLFDSDELQDLLVPTVTAKADATDAGKDASEIKTGDKKRVQCPECSHRFIPGWS